MGKKYDPNAFDSDPDGSIYPPLLDREIQSFLNDEKRRRNKRKRLTVAQAIIAWAGFSVVMGSLWLAFSWLLSEAGVTDKPLTVVTAAGCGAITMLAWFFFRVLELSSDN